MPIEVKNLNHSFKEGTPFEKQVLFDINLRIEDGEVVGLIGPTRSGKTTLAQHFNALHVPRQGKVMVEGWDTSDPRADLLSLRHQVGYVFQNPEHQLFQETVGKDVAFGPLQQGCSAKEAKRRAEEAMERVGLDYPTFVDRDIFALSGGQKRRAALAGVLASYPRVLVLDDLTAGLDPRGREDIMEVIKRLHWDEELTIVLISSSMDVVARFSRRLVVMDHGRLVMDGSAEEIFSQEERLRSLGLEPPQIVTILQLLREKGWEIPTGILDLEEAVEAIDTVLQGGEVKRAWN